VRLGEYFDRIYIINLPERADRLQSITRELDALGIVRVPHAPRPLESNGFPSRGVYGNFLSHLNILNEALTDGLSRTLVLEDDAIFRTSFRKASVQEALIAELNHAPWDMCFLGHSLTTELRSLKIGFVESKAEFRWAHCYCVHKRVLPSLIKYLNETLANSPGDPRGGRMYIDGALSMFRRFNPEVHCFLSNPRDPSRRLLQSIRRYQSAKVGHGLIDRVACKYWALLHRVWSVVTQAEIDLNCNIGGASSFLIPMVSLSTQRPE
jgi:glycosyl transferase, family 25